MAETRVYFVSHVQLKYCIVSLNCLYLDIYESLITKFMVTHTKTNVSCDSSHTIVYIGNARLKTFVETDPRYVGIPATKELQIDIIAEPGYSGVEFSQIKLFLEIVGPAGAKFVLHGNRIPFQWHLPHGTGWTEVNLVGPAAPAAAITSRLLAIPHDPAAILSGPGNGKTFRIGIRGMNDTDRLEFKASAQVARIVAEAKSCEVKINMGTGESSASYLR